MPLPAVRHCQLPNCLLRLAVRLAHLRFKDATAAPKHNGSEGRIGPAAGSPECQASLSERLETSCKPCLYLPFGTAIPNCLLRLLSGRLETSSFTCRSALPGSKLLVLRLAGGVRLAHLRSKDAAAAPKHHGSEGRIGPAAGSPECQTSLSERLETSCKPCLYQPFGSASFQIACCVLQVAFVWHTSGSRTLPHYQNTMAVKDGSGPRPAAQTPNVAS